jgi:hypothetical protein
MPQRTIVSAWITGPVRCCTPRPCGDRGAATGAAVPHRSHWLNVSEALAAHAPTTERDPTGRVALTPTDGRVARRRGSPWSPRFSVKSGNLPRSTRRRSQRASEGYRDHRELDQPSRSLCLPARADGCDGSLTYAPFRGRSNGEFIGASLSIFAIDRGGEIGCWPRRLSRVRTYFQWHRAPN